MRFAVKEVQKHFTVKIFQPTEAYLQSKAVHLQMIVRHLQSTDARKQGDAMLIQKFNFNKNKKAHQTQKVVHLRQQQFSEFPNKKTIIR